MNKKGWKQIPMGGVIITPGNSKDYKTGDWRTFRPILDYKRCIHCLTCFIHCPDSSIKASQGQMKGFDYDHCKGCGICASVCPVKCIEMKNENEIKD